MSFSWFWSPDRNLVTPNHGGNAPAVAAGVVPQPQVPFQPAVGNGGAGLHVLQPPTPLHVIQHAPQPPQPIQPFQPVVQQVIQPVVQPVPQPVVAVLAQQAMVAPPPVNNQQLVVPPALRLAEFNVRPVPHPPNAYDPDVNVPIIAWGFQQSENHLLLENVRNIADCIGFDGGYECMDTRYGVAHDCNHTDGSHRWSYSWKYLVDNKVVFYRGFTNPDNKWLFELNSILFEKQLSLIQAWVNYENNMP